MIAYLLANRALWALYELARDPKGETNAQIVAKLRCVARLITITRCRMSLKCFDIYNALIALHRPDIAGSALIDVQALSALAQCHSEFTTSELIGLIEAEARDEPTAADAWAFILKMARLHQPDIAASTHPVPTAGGLATPVSNRQARFAGIYDRYPDTTGCRHFEGGLRLTGQLKNSRLELPLVSIVTALYDNHQTLQRCIDSVKVQTYPNIEHIVVDGGSPRATIEILEKNAEQLDYYVSEPDSGIYCAINKGIRLARGDYICLLNSDDFYEADFVEKAVMRARESGADIVYTDYTQGGQHMAAQNISAGVLFGHLNICHNTFLTSADSYNRVGSFDEHFRIVSDAVWIRKAWRTGLRFERLQEVLFTLTEGGMSSGNTEARRELFIREIAESYRAGFPELTLAEAEEIYLLRFNKKRVEAIVPIAKRHAGIQLFRDALARYVEYCFGERKNFELHHSEATSTFRAMTELAHLIGADRKTIRINTKHGQFSDLLTKIDALAARQKPGARRRVLHFLTVFSAPSETFIYDLIIQMQAEPTIDNVVIFEHAKLVEERPFENSWHMPWGDFRPEVAVELYRYFLDRIAPDVVIAHFAINAHRFYERIAPLGRSFPTLVMTHGIDVFELKRPSDYTNYVVRNLSQRNDVAFTAVSQYLANELKSAGISDQKITVVPNTVNPRFFSYRKTSNFWDGRRALEILCIGRLVDWKGHDVLLDALADARRVSRTDLRLTIVFGNWAERLQELRAQIDRLGLSAHVQLVPFVDFDEQPDYLSRFDLYVHPSTYSVDSLRKSETFGVAVLEAIAAGLPVIASDAGGLPEVLGEDSPFSHIVPHGDAQALATAIVAMVSGRKGFADNRTYAEARLACFDPARRLVSLTQLMDRVTTQPIRAALFSTSTIQGAGYAAFRLHRGLRRTTVLPHMFTTVRNHENEPDLSVIGHPSGSNRNWASRQFTPKPGYTIFTVNQTHIPSAQLLQMIAPYDVINLHWYARFLSAENVATLTHSGKPVVMTIRDMQPITGGCHFFHGCTRWQSDCAGCPQLPEGHNDLAAKLLSGKRAHYSFDNLTLVTVSKHTRGILEKAPLFRDCRIETIPNSIETDVFVPYDKAAARAEFDLPQDRPIIGYVPSFSSEVKGYREILAALERITGRLPCGDPFIVLVGNETPASKEIRLDKKTLGYIGENARLARAYSSADVIVVPSLEETFSNTTAEAISCGVPVVGFKTGAIPDLALDGKTGYTYPVGDVAGLAEGILRVLTGPDMSGACRAHAEETLAFMTQAHRYEALFTELVQAARARIVIQHNRQGARRDVRPALGRPVWDCFDTPEFRFPSFAATSIST